MGQYAQIAARQHADVKHGARKERLIEAAKSLGYCEEEIGQVPGGAIEMGLGCGNPTAVAELRAGEIVLDLGCGAGLDVLVAARKVGPQGKVIGVDMTAEMVQHAVRFAAEGGYNNVEFRVGRVENLPLADQSVDVIISNCVLNHAPDKLAVFREAWRVLRCGGRMHVADLVVEGELPPPGSPGLEVWAEWLNVACGRQPYLDAMYAAGFRVVVAADGMYDGPGMVPALAGKIISLQLKAHKK